MAERSLPTWKKMFDAVEKVIAPPVNEFVRSEDFATLAALNKRGQTEVFQRLEKLSRRTLHVFNLPAGSDVNRLLTHIAQLEREVRDLRKEVSDGNDTAFLASLSAQRVPELSAAPKTAAPKRVAPKTAAPKRVAPKTAAPRKAVPKTAKRLVDDGGR